MQVDDLRRELVEARDHLLTADPVKGRRATDRRIRRHRLQRTGVASLLVLVLIGGGVFLATRGTDEQRVISGPFGLPHYLPEPLPEGVATLDEFPSASSAPDVAVGEAEALVFTNDDSELPTADSSVLLLTVITPADQGSLTDERLITPDPEVYIGKETANAFWSQDGYTFQLMGRGIDEGAFRSAAASAEVLDDGEATLTSPAGYREVARVRYPLSSYFTSSLTPLVGSAGYLAQFDLRGAATVAGSPVGQSLAVAAWPRSFAWVLATERLQPTEVRGHQGYLILLRGTSESASAGGTESEAIEVDIGVRLIWWEGDDVMLSVTAGSEDAAQRFAGSLREVDDAVWNDFVASTRLPEIGGDATSQTVVSSGTAIAQVPSSTVTVP